MAACRRDENFFSLSPTLHPFPSAINTPRIPFFQATESFISQKLRLILPPLPSNIPTLKWQRLVMIYGPNFILFLFFFSSRIALVPLPSLAVRRRRHRTLCVSCNLCCFHASLNMYIRRLRNTNRVPYIIII